MSLAHRNRNRNRMAKFAKGATSFQRLLYIISIRLFNLFNQAIETYMIKRQFLEIKLACRAIQLRLICIPRQLIFLKWSNVTNDPMSQMIQCLKWSNVSNDPTTFEKRFLVFVQCCDNQGIVCICVYKSPLFNRGWCSKPCYAISYGRKSKLEKAGHFEAQTCDRPWGRGWGGGQGGRLIPIRRLAQMHKYTSAHL